MYNGVARSSYRQHSCDDVMKLGLCDWFTNELTDWRRRKEITYRRIGRTSGLPIPKNVKSLISISPKNLQRSGSTTYHRNCAKK